MSTKSSIKSGDDFHLYKDVFEKEDSIYLELENADLLEINFEYKTRLTIRFSHQKAIELGLISNEDITANYEQQT